MYLYGNEEKMENEASDKKKDIKRGVQDGIPIALGYLSVSFAFGIMAVSAGLTPWQAILSRLYHFIGCKCNIGGTVCRC